MPRKLMDILNSALGALLTWRTRRGRERLFDRPAAIKAVLERFEGHSELFSPIGYAVRTATAAATSKCWASHFRVPSAVTDAVPVALAGNVAYCLVNDGPLTESLASQIYESRATSRRMGLVHQKNLLTRFGRWIGPSGSCNLPLGPCHYGTSCVGGQAHAHAA